MNAGPVETLPIGPGLVSGVFEVLGGVSRNGGPLCPVDVPDVPPSADCGECAGKVTELTLLYSGTVGAHIQVVQKSDEVVFDSDIDDVVVGGSTFTFVGTEIEGKGKDKGKDKTKGSGNEREGEGKPDAMLNYPIIDTYRRILNHVSSQDPSIKLSLI